MAYFDYFGLPMHDSAVVIVALTVGLAGVGVAVAYVIGDPFSPATRALAFAVGVVGIANAVYPAQHVLHPDGEGLWWLVRLPVLDALVMAALLVWMLRVSRATGGGGRVRQRIGASVTAFTIVTAVYLVLGWLYPMERMTRFVLCLGTETGCTGWSFWKFAIPVTIMASLLVRVGLLVYSQGIDAAERVRVISVAVATPFFFANYVLPAGYNVLTSLPGLFVFLVGGVRYQTIQGDRGRFLSRFLSSAVVQEVHEQGLAQTLQPQRVELTVVNCDLRGFTRFAAANDSALVMLLIGEYYQAVGAVVARYEATLQDYSGDGIMVVVGAPIPLADHAARGVAIGEGILRAVNDLATRWRREDTPLGVGIGIATGPVTVGAITSTTRMEYTVVGTAANLSARLCDVAGPGEILVAAETVAQIGADGFLARPPIELKGLGEVEHYVRRPESSGSREPAEPGTVGRWADTQ